MRTPNTKHKKEGSGPMVNINWKQPDAGKAFLAAVVADALDQSLLEAVKENSLNATKAALQRDANPNWQDDAGMTALHHAAATGARTALRALVSSGKCDYLIADKLGRYPSDLAIEWSRDFAVARLLTTKRLQQADAQGLPCREHGIKWRTPRLDDPKAS